MARLLAVCFQKCSVHLFEWTFFSEVPLDHLIRFRVLKLPFPLFFFVIFGSGGVWSCWSDSLQSELIFHIFKCVFQLPPSFFSPLIWFCSCSSVVLVLAGSNINADVTEFLKLQLVGINRNCKRIPLPHFALFLTNYCPFKSCRRMGIWK